MGDSKVWAWVGRVSQLACIIALIPSIIGCVLAYRALQSGTQANTNAQPQQGTVTMGLLDFNHLLFYALLLFCFIIGFACVLNVIAMRKGGLAFAPHPAFTPARQTASPITQLTASNEPKALALLDVIPECSSRHSRWTYKSKIRVVLRNDTERAIEVTGLYWSSAPSEVECQQQVEATLQVEGPKGWRRNDWGPDLSLIDVRPQQVFRLWVGLSLDVSRVPDDRFNELRQRAVINQLGTVHIIVDRREWKLHI